MVSISDIISALRVTPSPADTELIKRAYTFAENAHKGQKRYSGEQHFAHAAETGKELADLGMSPVTIAAGLLHDVVEDGKTTDEEILKEFGKEILFLVEGVTKLGKIKYHGAERHNESLRKLFVAMSQDIRVLIIKLADRLHNMRTLQYVPEHKQKRIATETLEIYAPIAYRLGIRKLNRELENLSFPYVYPEVFKEIEALVKKIKKEGAPKLEKFQNSLRKALAKGGIRNFKSHYRIKSLYSLYKKYLRKEKDVAKIYDILAIRVIVPTIEDCYKVIGIIHSTWRPLPGRIKDYIAFPKPNSYQSLHTTVFTGDGSIVEIHVKTESMHIESEYGITSHLSYKGQIEKSKDAKQNPALAALSWIRSLLPSLFSRRKDGKEPSVFGSKNADVPTWIKELVDYQASLSTNETEFVDKLKGDFFAERIFTFTPKGDVIDLPINSTPVDFAYYIHSDIGNHMAGVKINEKLVSFDTVLANGDIVEIITKKSAAPTSRWLDSAITTLARKQIRIALDKARAK
ncbi:MAG: HD domain-containing protein [Patescibacteria group bacterium]